VRMNQNTITATGPVCPEPRRLEPGEIVKVPLKGSFDEQEIASYLAKLNFYTDRPIRVVEVDFAGGYMWATITPEGDA